MRDESEINRAVEEYADMVRRVCFYHLKNREDTEDVFQNVFLKYMLCKDYVKSFFRRNAIPLETLREMEAGGMEEHREVLEAVLALPGKYKDVIYLHYYEGYSASEIGRILGKKENTVYSLLSRGRGMLKEELGGERIHE